jgi:hypothetical protein
MRSRTLMSGISILLTQARESWVISSKMEDTVKGRNLRTRRQAFRRHAISWCQVSVDRETYLNIYM